MRESPPSSSQILGIFARTFSGPTLGDVLDQVGRHEIEIIQLNLASAGLATLPETLDEAACAAVARSVLGRGLRLAAVSGTFNLIDPDRPRRTENLRRLGVLASACPRLGARIITLCTGTRDPHDMWRAHPENDSAETWAELVESMRVAAEVADRWEITLAFEPEVGNVVDSATKARKLLDEIGSPRLKVVLDPANLVRPADLGRMRPILDEAFDLLGEDIALLHAKEIGRDGATGDLAPGRGVMDFAHVFRHYERLGLEVPVVMHGLPAAEVQAGRDHLRAERNAAIGGRSPWLDGGFEDRPMNRLGEGATHHVDFVAFRHHDIGGGLPLVFQHGLGGDAQKMRDLVRPRSGVRLFTFDARYHGMTRPLGPPEKIGFEQSADDLLALLDHRGIERAVIGGLSMGAGIALNFAIRHPERTLGLILSRPAWLDEPFPENVRLFPEMAALIRTLGRQAAREAFAKTETYANLLARSTDSAAAMLGMFDDPTCEETVEKFERIPRDCPSRDRSAWRSIRVLTLVLANHQDPIHPYAMGEELAAAIPGAELRTLTPKCVDLARHESEFNEHVGRFLDMHFADLMPA